MYWDVVDVKPEPGYCLFVRFKDGLAGRVQLHREDLTGALAPLLDARFFEQVFIDCGVVAWPGEIDLAPDAMYDQVANRLAPQPAGEVLDESTLRSRLPRLYELKDRIPDPSNPNAYFSNFENLLREGWLETFSLLEQRLQRLDPKAWEDLKGRASSYLSKKDPTRGWEQLLGFLDGEASAYNYLRELVGCSKVCFIPERPSKRTPDLEGVRDNERFLCEVKTINISDYEVKTRCGPPTARDVYNPLGPRFFGKLDSNIKNAKTQLQTYDPRGEAFHLVYLRIYFDDRSGIYDNEYFKGIKQHLVKRPPGIKVVASPGFSETDPCVVAQQTSS